MKRTIKLIVALMPLISFAALAMAATVSAPLNTQANVSCATTGATAIPASTPAAHDPSGQPNRLCVSLEDLDASNPVFVGDCTTTSATTGYKLYASGPSFTYCGSSALCCFGSGGTVSISVTETTKQ